MATRTKLYIDTVGGLDLDGSTDKNLSYFVGGNLATLVRGVDGSCAKHLTVEYYMVVMLLTFVLLFLVFHHPLTLSFRA